MSMSTSVVGFIPPDSTWEKMRAVWDACAAAGVDPPGEVSDFFGDEPPDAHGREVELPHREWKAEMREGVEVDVSALPPNVKVVRFYNSW